MRMQVSAACLTSMMLRFYNCDQNIGRTVYKQNVADLDTCLNTVGSVFVEFHASTSAVSFDTQKKIPASSLMMSLRRLSGSSWMHRIPLDDVGHVTATDTT